MEPLSANEIRSRFLAFFAAREHEVVPSASLVPAGDQTLLFTNSGMVQFKDVFRGVEQRSYTRAVDAQRCLRVAGKHNDFEEVGRTPRHHTLFEMLGNWSFGDYFKREAIHWAWELLTVDLGIPAERLAATTYRDDEESWRVWRDEIGLPAERMARWGDVDAGDDKNFWRMADTGPCGPCSEIHYDRGVELSEGPHCLPDHSEHCPRWLELWNLVFMEFDQQPDGRRVPLPFRSVDTGMGLERLASVLQGVGSNYDTDLFTPIHARMRELLGHDPDAFESERFSYQVIADHSRAITFLIADGVLPANEGRGYVLRRIVRRAVRHGRLLGRHEPFLAETAEVVIDLMGDAYPVLRERREAILGAIMREETAFARTLDAGTVQLEEALIPLTSAERVVGRRPEDVPEDAPRLDGETAFRLHDTYGFPIDLTVELAAEYGVRVDRDGFDAALRRQRERSRSGTKQDLVRQAELVALFGGIARRRATGIMSRPGEPALRHLPTMRPSAGSRSQRSSWATRRRPRAGRSWPSSATARSTRSSRRAATSSSARMPRWMPSSSSTGRPSTPRAAARSATAASSATPGARSSSRSTTRSGRSAVSSSTTVGCTAGWPRPGGDRRGRRRPPRPHDAQPHRHAPAPPRPA